MKITPASLFELFTLGEGNGYTQDDILETSRALTGFNHWNDYGAVIYFDSSTFDAMVKKPSLDRLAFGVMMRSLTFLFQERSK